LRFVLCHFATLPFTFSLLHFVFLRNLAAEIL
jgi:hypothetical protein